jgi:DNA-directed RNA polymerase specialized sigma24 family protein
MTKEQLRNFRKIKDEHARIEQRLRTLEKRPESEVEILQPLRTFYRSKLEALATAQLEIERALETLDYTERELIRLRYIDGLEWHQVCAAINYSWQQTHRIHARVLKKLDGK